MEYGQMIAMQMGAGKGPDILVSYAFNFMDGVAEKGGFADLAPYMNPIFSFTHWISPPSLFTTLNYPKTNLK